MGLIRVANALGAALMRNDVCAVTNTLTVADFVTIPFGIAARFNNGSIWAFRQATAAGNAFIGRDRAQQPGLEFAAGISGQ